ncbi:MAG: serine/threonine-protein kinase, partial [Verrucomicrobiota bacterium]
EWNFEERFVMEARAMARLDHPNIVKIHDFGETENKLPYIVMEYVEGVDLGELVFGKLITVEHVGSWIPQVCEALEYAHNHELVHRDVKPANIMITLDGEVKIMDFGLVKMRGGPGSAGLTEARMSVGTPRYLAPEAVESGAHVDHRADIYSVGVVLYELLTGAPPSGAWRPPSALFPFLDPRLDAVVVRALQPEPNDRYSRVIDLGREVLDILTGSSSGQRRLLTQGGTGPRALNCPNPTPRDQGHSVLGGLQP